MLLAATLALAAVLRSHLLPLTLLTLMGVAAGFIVAADSGDPRGITRYPLLGGLTVLVLVGIGQLGPIGLLAGALLLALLLLRRERVQ
ncbi:hypothetical protein GON03_05505 [Nocardioides sp. MAH-18]|uniref:Uncharacterized protein n=1 Tax=Nocardioides agri TaxID=2682843 RepID=A0A6L6XMZ1_9ACTN|nr:MULTISPECIES: hypothetical protein [unclassified Nocardioides]MBA2953764.1 hypothetical protein [Nocardioides sp. CGMCC 1.13656]MVQ48629.1 hypothetical protein [Nocardioides sp. MAH-18]